MFMSFVDGDPTQKITDQCVCIILSLTCAVFQNKK